MDPVHARYPFLPAAREAVGSAAVDLAEVVASEERVVERARERVEHAIDSLAVGEPDRSERVELLSYPVARVLVSLLEEPALTRRYARAEAETAIERLRADAEGSTPLRSVTEARLSLEAFLAGMGLEESVAETEDGYAVDVGTYLELADDLEGEGWRLVDRALHGGTVPVSEAELFELLRGAVADRVARDLPLSVPDAIGEAVAEQVAALRGALSEFDVDRDIDAVEPDRFPPCVQALDERIREGASLPDHSQFAYAAFLSAIGMEAGEIVDRLAAHPDVEEAAAAYRIDHLTDGGTAAYPPPSCATMQAYGDCVNRDSICATIAHPLEYYERRLDGAVPEDDQPSRPESQ